MQKSIDDKGGGRLHAGVASKDNAAYSLRISNDDVRRNSTSYIEDDDDTSSHRQTSSPPPTHRPMTGWYGSMRATTAAAKNVAWGSFLESVAEVNTTPYCHLRRPQGMSHHRAIRAILIRRSSNFTFSPNAEAR